MITETLYKNALKPVLFKFDPETVHNRFSDVGRLLGSNGMSRMAVRSMFYYSHNSLQTTVAGIKFENPVGLAAGFDKNAKLYNILPEIGFGFAELGSITGEPCKGNPRPRLFRFPKDKSILVNYGLYNQGCEVLSKKLQNLKFKIPIGISVAKTNTPNIKTTAEGIADYRKAYRYMHPIGAYTTINVSCPNTADGQTFGHPENLAPLLSVIDKELHMKPIFLKIKPDMNENQMGEIIKIIERYDWLTGVIMGNLTLNRQGLNTSKDEIDKVSLKGGLSGLPTQKKSNDLIKFVHKNSNKVIIGCGGIFDGKDAYEKLKCGASLLQMITGMIYEGPAVISKINRELVDLMQKNGVSNVSEIKNS